MEFYSPAAIQDLIETFDYLLDESQSFSIATRYCNEIERICHLIKDQPYIGRHRDDVDPQYRSFPVHSHLIFYRVTDDQVQIGRILHGSRDIAKALHRR